MEFSTMTPALMNDPNTDSAQKNIADVTHADTQNANEKQSVQNTCDNNTTAANISQGAVADSGKFSGARTILENLPAELLNQKRFFPVRITSDRRKVPCIKAWQNPNNQMTPQEAIKKTGLIGMDIREDYFFIDFDHVLDASGNFVFEDAERWDNYLETAETYREKSISGDGLHRLLKPTPNKFPKLTGGKNHSIFFSENNTATKIELFYKQNRYILLTGDTDPNSKIISGDAADELCQQLINQLSFDQAKIKDTDTETDSADISAVEVQKMLAKIPCAKTGYSEWWKVAAIIHHHFGANGFEMWRAWSETDKPRYTLEDCQKVWRDLDTRNAAKIGKHAKIGSLIHYAKKFGYRPPRKAVTFDTDGEDHMTQDFIKDCPVNLRLPDNYIFNNGGIVLVVPPKKDNEEPKYICAAETPIIPTKIFREPQKNIFSYEIAIRFRDTWRTVEVEGRALADPKAIITLADKGALLLEPKIICRFLNRVIALNPALQEIKAYSQTGWTDDTFKTFAYPGIEDCILRRAGFDFDRDLSKRGDPELWKKKFVEVINKGGAVAAMYIGTALASILARPLNIMNPQAHLCGTSGGGKTALQKFTSSIFGNPRELLRSFAATNKNRQLVSAAFCDLPTFYDELETLQGKNAEEQLSNDVYNFADGKGNQANKRDGSARETFRFGGARLTTGERPILKDNDLRGAYKRLIQLCIQGQLFDDNFAADLHIFSESDFGHFGYQWIQYATEHFDEIQKHYQHYAACNNPTLKIFEPTHLKSVTAALVAVEFFKVMLGINATFDEDGAFIRNRREIVDHYLPTLADLDDTARALKSLESYVASHEKAFARDVKDGDTGEQVEITSWGTVCSGKLFDSGAVAFFPTELTRILEDELHFASADKLINEWCQQEVLIPDKKQRTRVIKIGKKTYRVYFFKAGTIACASDSEGRRQTAS